MLIEVFTNCFKTSWFQMTSIWSKDFSQR